jgi:WD40 repeat protein
MDTGDVEPLASAQLGRRTEERVCCFSPDRRLAVTGLHGHTVRLWDARDGRCLKVMEGHCEAVVNAAWSCDNRRALSCDTVGGLRVWDVSE